MRFRKGWKKEVFFEKKKGVPANSRGKRKPRRCRLRKKGGEGSVVMQKENRHDIEEGRRKGNAVFAGGGGDRGPDPGKLASEGRKRHAKRISSGGRGREDKTFSTRKRIKGAQKKCGKLSTKKKEGGEWSFAPSF